MKDRNSCGGGDHVVRVCCLRLIFAFPCLSDESV